MLLMKYITDHGDYAGDDDDDMSGSDSRCPVTCLGRDVL